MNEKKRWVIHIWLNRNVQCSKQKCVSRHKTTYMCVSAKLTKELEAFEGIRENKSTMEKCLKIRDTIIKKWQGLVLICCCTDVEHARLEMATVNVWMCNTI